MSAVRSQIKQPLQIVFPIPAALNQDTIGTDAITGVNSFTPTVPNVITDIRHNVNP